MSIQSQGRITYVDPSDPLVKRCVVGGVELLFGRRSIERLYREIWAGLDEVGLFWESALAKLRIQVDYCADQFAKIPNKGPIVFVANHPFGVIDGLIICKLASRSRRDFKILINSALCTERALDEYFLPIDFAETSEAQRANITSKRIAIDTLNSGGAVLVFPAGGAATASKVFGRARELEWKLFPAKIIQKTKATVVPIKFHGQNSLLFQFASKLSMTVRLSLYLNEVRNKVGKRIHVSIGDPLPYSELEHLRSRQELTGFLKNSTLSL